jgi:hypothetical protein
MLIVQKLYKPSDFPVTPTPNLTAIWAAINNIKNWVPKDYDDWQAIKSTDPRLCCSTFENWCELMFLFDTYIGNTTLFELNKIIKNYTPAMKYPEIIVKIPSTSYNFEFITNGTLDIYWGDGSSDLNVTGTIDHLYNYVGIYTIILKNISGLTYFYTYLPYAAIVDSLKNLTLIPALDTASIYYYR